MKARAHTIWLSRGGALLLMASVTFGFQPPPTIYDLALRGDLKEVKRLLAKGADVNSRGSTGWTLLHYAVYYKHEDLAKLLIAKGADVKAKTEKQGWTPLHNATQMDVVNILIAKGADINARDESGCTPLFLPVLAKAELLIAKGAEVNAKDKSGETPLHRAAADGKLEVAALLIAKGADVKAKRNDGKTPLHVAAERAHKEIYDLLIAKGADAADKDDKGQAPQMADSVSPLSFLDYGNLLVVLRESGARLVSIDGIADLIPLPNVPIPGTRLGGLVSSGYYVDAGDHTLEVDFVIERDTKNLFEQRVIAKSDEIMKVFLTVEDGHYYILSAGTVDSGKWAPVLVDLKDQFLLSNLVEGFKSLDPLVRIKTAIAAATTLRAREPDASAAQALALPLSEMLYEPEGLPYARAALKELGALATPILLNNLGSGDPALTSSAVLALGELGIDAKDAIPPLLGALEDSSLRHTAATALINIIAAAAAKKVEIGKAGVAAFIERLKHPSDDWTREFAAKALGDIGPEAGTAIPALTEAQTTDPSKPVRNAAGKALKKIRR